MTINQIPTEERNTLCFDCEHCIQTIKGKDCMKEKDKQKCSCGGKLKRVIEWSGIAESTSKNGWFGKSDGSKAI